MYRCVAVIGRLRADAVMFVLLVDLWLYTFVSFLSCAKPVCVCLLTYAGQVLAEQLFRMVVLPELVRRVNSAPEYAPLRSVYYVRLIAEWYKQQAMVVRKAPFADIIGAFPRLGDRFFVFINVEFVCVCVRGCCTEHV